MERGPHQSRAPAREGVADRPPSHRSLLEGPAALIARPVPLAATRPIRQAVLRPHQTLEELASHEPPGAFAAGVFDGDELIAVGLIGPQGEPGSWRVRGMATVPHARGRGAGTAVLNALLDHAVAEGAHHVWANVRTGARSLYERAGFHLSSEEFDLPEIGPHFVAERTIGAGGRR